MRNRSHLIAGLLACCALTPALAGLDSFYGDRHRGWFFHETPPVEQVEPKPMTPPPAPAPAPAKPAEPAPMSVAWIKQNLEKAKLRAIDDPSKENLEAYFAIQRIYFDKSSKFSAAYQDALKTSAFDENANWSAAQFGQRAAEESVNESQKKLMTQLANVAGIWMFYRSDCSYCKAELPVLINLKETYGISTLPIAMDNLPLPGAERLGKFVPDAGQSAQLGVQATPTIFMVHPATNTLIPIAQGAIAQDELITRMLDAAVKAGFINTDSTTRLRLTPTPEAVLPQNGATVNTDDPKAVTAYIKQQLRLR
jgi:conjugal transfer pilus assembly protein TraF